MNKIYIIWYDNGQDWEDHFKSIEKICSTKEKADEELLKLQRNIPTLKYNYYIEEYDID